MKSFVKNASALVMAFVFLMTAMPAFADGIPQPWGLGLQPAGSPIEKFVDHYHNILLVVITAISIFVLLLLIWVVVRYNRAMNPKATRTAHNITLEIIWTLVPCFVLLGLAFISFPLLYYTERVPQHPDLTLKVTGHQWYWSYEYPDNGALAFDSHAIWDSSNVTADQAKKLIADVSPGWLIKNDPLRLLEVDNRVVLPVGKFVRVQVLGSDVEHSWFIPSLAVNRMAVPGHMTELWIKVDHEGIYYGQCSMICGQGHGYMPIVIEGVAPEKFAAWLDDKKKALGQNTVGVTKFAAN